MPPRGVTISIRLRWVVLWITVGFALPAATIAADGAGTDATAQSSSQAAPQPATQSAPQPSLFRDSTDGAFDVSGFLSTRVGFPPIAMPITEPAVGYGLGLGLMFFHDHPQVVNYRYHIGREHDYPGASQAFGATLR